jgi:hypothetical protein
MRVNVQVRTTSRFIDLWCYIAVAIAGVVFIALVMSWFWGQRLVSTTLQVDEGEPETLDPIQIERETIGALRIDVKANIATNHWVTYEIQLQDQYGQVLASAIKDAWAESGIWHEDGESGSWYEDDLLAGLDVKAIYAEPVTITLDVLEHTDTGGTDIDAPVTFNVQVRNGVVDGRYLWAGFIGTVGLAALAIISVQSTGDRVIFQRIPDSDVSGRAVLGGANRLVRVTVKIKSDETSPYRLTVKLFVKDDNGEQIYARDYPVKLHLTRNKQRYVTGATGSLCQFFILEPRISYGFYMEVVPDGPADETRLIVRENAKTLGPVSVTYLRAVQ